MEMAEGFRKSLSSLQNFAEKVNIQLNIILRCKDDSIALTLLADRPAIFRQLNGSDGRALTHGQSSYWTAKSSFLFLASDHTEADLNYTLGVDFWTMIFYNLKNSG